MKVLTYIICAIVFFLAVNSLANRIDEERKLEVLSTCTTDLDCETLWRRLYGETE